MSQRAPAVKNRPDRAKASKSAAVRAALANPSRQQHSRWQRERRNRLLILAAAVSLVVVALLVLAFGYWREQFWYPSLPAARVHNEDIALAALAQRVGPQLAALDRELMRVASQPPPSAGTNPNSDPSRQLQILQTQRMMAPDQVLTDMIDEELIRLETARRGLVVSPAEIEARINTDLARSRPPPADSSSPTPAGPALAPAGPTPTPTPPPTLTADEFQPAYTAFLERIGFTDQRYRAYIEAQVQRDKLRDALAGAQAREQEQVRVRRLTVGSQEEATAALAQIRTGERSFEDVARDKSLDLLSKSQGGELGWRPRGIESAQFDEAAFRQALNEVGDPVVTPQGWEILQVLERAVRPLSDEQLDRLKAKAMDDWIRQARDDPGVRKEMDRERREWVIQHAQPGSRRGASGGGPRPGF